MFKPATLANRERKTDQTKIKQIYIFQTINNTQVLLYIVIDLCSVHFALSQFYFNSNEKTNKMVISSESITKMNFIQNIIKQTLIEWVNSRLKIENKMQRDKNETLNCCWQINVLYVLLQHISAQLVEPRPFSKFHLLIEVIWDLFTFPLVFFRRIQFSYPQYQRQFCACHSCDMFSSRASTSLSHKTCAFVIHLMR